MISRYYITLLLILQAFFGSLYAATVAELEERVQHEEVKPEMYVTAESLFRRKTSDEWQEAVEPAKVRRLWLMVKPYVGARIDYQKFAQVLGFVALKQSDILKNLKDEALYIHKSKILPLPVQVFKDGTVYIHLRNDDQKRKRGGYKKFSRTLDVTNERLIASLVTRNEKSIPAILRELRTMEKIHSNRSLNWHHASLYVGHQDDGKLVHKLSFQTELFNGDFGSFNRTTKKDLILSFALAAAKSVHSIHQHGIIHRDIKAENFFMSDEVGLVLGDFGLSHEKDMLNFGKSLAGTRGFMAPGICINRARAGQSFHTFADGVNAEVYSLGMMFYGLLYGKDNVLRRATFDVNVAALPKDKKQRPSLADTLKGVKELKTIHTRLQQKLQMIPRSADNRASLLLLELSLRMTDANPAKRPTMEEVIVALGG